MQDLPVCIAKNELNPDVPQDKNFIITKWKLTPEDIRRIVESEGEIWMVTLGRGVLPVRLLSDNPFSNHGFEAIDLEAEQREIDELRSRMEDIDRDMDDEDE